MQITKFTFLWKRFTYNQQEEVDDKISLAASYPHTWIEPIMEHNQLAHEHNVEFLNEMRSLWI